jgi:hypothetical protein
VLAKRGAKVALFERKLSIGGGMWGGRIGYNVIVVQKEAKRILDTFEISSNQYDGLRIDPCIPSGWKSFKVERRYRGKTLRIEVLNSDEVEKGVKEILLNGERVANLILERLKL